MGSSQQAPQLIDHTGGPTILRLAVGRELRRWREASGVSREAAGYAIRASDSKISRMELGRVGFKERDLADLLALYQVPDPQRAALLSLAAQANAPGWWHRYHDVHPKWFQFYLGLEGGASTVQSYEVQFVPGLLQTRQYAEAVVRLGHPDAASEEVARRVELRLARQQALNRPPPAHLWVVVDEAALRRPVGGPAVMRAQLQALIEAAARPHVTLQVMPFLAGGHAAAGGAFTLLRFTDPDLSDVVYLEQLTGALYVEQPAEVAAYHTVWERLCADAVTPELTIDLLSDLLAADGGAATPQHPPRR